MASEMVYPRGGWSRAMRYIVHRLRRLPDPPHRVGRGVAAGVFISFTPLFGLHLVGSIGLAWAIRGNLLAAVIGSLIGNPVTIPLIALMSVAMGRWLLGIEGSIAPAAIFEAFASASRQLSHNLMAAFDGRAAEWDRLGNFFDTVFLPYLVGGLGPGLVTAIAFHHVTVPLVKAYQRRRTARLARRADASATAPGPTPRQGAATAQDATDADPDR